MQIERIPVDVIVVEDRLRHIDPKKVDDLTESIRKLGLRTPISVRYHEEYTMSDGEQVTGVLVLVAGNHRLEAAKLLEWEYIDSFILDDVSDADARLWEIAENLHRADLSVQERSDHIAEWVRLVSDNLSETKREGRPGVVAQAARELPVSGETDEAKRKNVERAVKIASIAPEAKKAATEAGVKSQKDLLEVAKAPVNQQIAKVTEIAQRRSKPVSPAPEPRNDIEVEEVQLTALMNAWNKASRTVRERFLETVQSPVFDTDPRQPTPLAH